MVQPEPQHNEVPKGRVVLTTATLECSHSLSASTTNATQPLVTRSATLCLGYPFSLSPPPPPAPPSTQLDPVCSPELHLEATFLKHPQSWLHTPSPTVSPSHCSALLVYLYSLQTVGSYVSFT